MANYCPVRAQSSSSPTHQTPNQTKLPGVPCDSRIPVSLTMMGFHRGTSARLGLILTSNDGDLILGRVSVYHVSYIMPDIYNPMKKTSSF